MSIETTIEDETKVESIKDLEQLFKQTKEDDKVDTSKLTDNFTLKGLDEVKEQIATAAAQIAELAGKGKEQSTASSLTSKAIAILPGSTALAKWFGVKSDEMKIEAIKQQSITQVVNGVIASIESKREEVVQIIEELHKIRERAIARVQVLETISDRVEAFLKQSNLSAREILDGQQLASSTKVSIEKLYSKIQSRIEPYIMSATLAVQKVQNIIPTIESDLLGEMGDKVAQQNLQDLIDMTQGITELTSEVSVKIKNSINETIYSSMELLANTGIDIKQLEASAKADIEHQEKIQKLAKKTQDKINESYQQMTQLHLTMNQKRAEHSQTLIAQYSTEK